MRQPVVNPYLDFYRLDDLMSQEQKLLVESVRSFLQTEVAPHIAEHFEAETFPTWFPKRAGAMGLLGPNLNGYGLPGLDGISYGLIMKEIERVDSGLRSFCSVQGGLVMYPIHAFGTEEQKKKWLPTLATGETIGCFGLTESEGGSDPGVMKTRVEDRGDHYLLNGSKMWITNGNLAKIAIVWAKLDGKVRGFIVPLDAAGVNVKQMKHKLSLRASITSELYFDQVRLSKDALLPKTEGLKSALSCLNQARYGIAWGVIGAAEACFAEALNYTKSRILFQKPLASFQLVQKKLAEMARDITHAQLLAWRLGQLKESDQYHPSQISMAKQANVSMALNVARTCRDILGANGIMLEYEAMRHMCNLETVYTYEGTNDVHHLIVGAELTGIAAFS